MAAPVYSATLFGNDTPDIRLGIGVQAQKAFDLEDFFDSSTSKTIGYTQDGTAVTDSVVNIFGNSVPANSSVTFVATANGETVEKSSVVQVSNFVISNGPAIDNNNRLAGVAAGNAFLNGIVPGSSVSSAQALTLSGSTKWGSLTGTAITGSAALIATIGQVNVAYAATGLVQRSCSVLAEATKGSATYSGLTASLTTTGTYTLAASSAFAGPFVVTFGQVEGTSADGVHLLAAKSTNVELAAANFYALAAGSFDMATYAFSGGVLTITAKANQGVLLVGQTGVTASGETTVSMNYKTTSAAATTAVAVVGFDTAGLSTLSADANKKAYSLIKGSALEANAVKNVATLINSRSGKVLPGLQVVNSGTSDITVTISELAVVNAGVLADYAINPNAEADLSVAGDLASITGLINDIAQTGALAGTASTENNFASPNGSGSLQLASASVSAPANGAVSASVDAGTFYGECWVKKVSTTDTGVFYFQVTDGLSGEFRSETMVSSLGSDWTKIDTMGVSAAAGTQYAVVQTTGATVAVDDLSVRLLEDATNFFDYKLLGL